MRYANHLLAAPLIALSVLYVTAYLLLVEPGVADVDFSTGDVEYRPNYRSGGRCAEVLLAPAVHVDRFLRPDRWRGTAMVY